MSLHDMDVVMVCCSNKILSAFLTSLIIDMWQNIDTSQLLNPEELAASDPK